MNAFKAGLLAIVVIAVAAYFGFTRANPFANPYELKALVRDAQNLKKGAPVRMAGVDVGKVTNVGGGDDGTSTVTMQLSDDALPIHNDARLTIRPRIVLEGNYFVQLNPGSPSARHLHDGSTLPVGQTSNSVSLSDIFSVLDTDVRGNLQTLLYEFGTKGYANGAAKALNRGIPSFEPAYRLSSLTNEALLGVQPTRDLQRVLRGQQRVFAALNDNPGDLQGLVRDLDITAGAIASHDQALAASVPALRDTLRVGYPALGQLNATLPVLRAFSREAIPGVRSTTPTLDAGIPWITQARGLVQEDELKGLSADLRHAVPSLARLNTRLRPALSQLRALSSCTNTVLEPFLESPIPSIEAGNANQPVRNQIFRSFVGLSGESRVFDANTPVFHIQGVAPSNLSTGRIEPAAPADPFIPPPHRPDVACETQQPPNLQAPSGSALDPAYTQVVLRPTP
jgi:phospholipid/cholesterol/gamma-HCH transport system substrate-binding protein